MDVAGSISTGCFIVDDIINNFIVIRSSPYERMGSGHESMREGRKKNLVHACNSPDILRNCESSCYNILVCTGMTLLLYYCNSMVGTVGCSDQQ